MGIASLKPYNMIGVQNKLNRMYGRKLSLRGQFSFATRFLKEKGKESTFEKPYLDLSRPQMHQDPPTRDWPSDPPPVGQYPPNAVDEKYHIYIFAPGIVGMFIHGPAECGEEPVSGSATVSLQAQHSEGAQNVWKFSSSDERVRVINETYWPPWSETSVDFDVEVDEDTDDGVEVEICVKVMLRGDLVRKIAVPMFEGKPLPGWEGTPQEAPTVTATPLEIWTDYVYPTECTTLEIECGCETPDVAFDLDGDETIGRNDSTILSLIDHEDCNFNWSVTGTGFTLASATGISNTLYSDGSACGAAHITATNADSYKVATGRIKCTYGVYDTYKPEYRECRLYSTPTGPNYATSYGDAYKINVTCSYNGPCFGCADEWALVSKFFGLNQVNANCRICSGGYNLSSVDKFPWICA